jgi:Predicted hydrolases or acyltransferases (alpha/beta hydrolase superfamily)
MAVGLALIGAGALVYARYSADMQVARATVAQGASVAQTATGPIQYAVEGTGSPMLSIHGAGGGFDQGLANAGSMLGPGFQIIAPSRFGYLGTPVPGDVSAASQAEAHVALLNELGVEEAIVLGTSAGTRSALELALRHPDRVSALILVVPATYVPDAAQQQVQRETEFSAVLWLVNAGADFAWWTLEHISPDTLMRFIGVPPEVVRAASAEEREEVFAMIRSIEPLSARFAGINIDSQPVLTAPALEQLSTPTLLVTARDDLFNTYPAAEYAADRIPGARLVVFDEEGHLLVGHSEQVRSKIRQFLEAAGLVQRED